MRLKQIDILRGVAVLLVLGRHLPPAPKGLPAAESFLFDTWLRGGWVGVDLFFVLSGFLVSGLLFSEYQRTQELRVGRFLLRRGFKIYPAFYFLIAATVLFLLPSNAPTPWPPTLAELFFVQNYLPGLWNHTWSLAVEEHFYLLLSALMFVLVRRRSDAPFKAIPYVFGFVAIASLIARIALRSTQPYNHVIHLFPTHLRLDGLMFGVFLSYLNAFHRPKLEEWVRPRARLLGWVGWLMVAPSTFLVLESSWFVPTVGLTLFYLGFGLVLLSVLFREESGRSTILSHLGRPLAFVGFYSYSIYLWHMPVLRVLIPRLIRWLAPTQLPFAAWAAIYVLLSVVLGALLGRIIEKPFLMIRDRFFPSRSAARAEATPVEAVSATG